MRRLRHYLSTFSIVFLSLGFNKSVRALTADRVFFEVLVNKGYKVRIKYTIPALREKREAYRVFTNRDEAVQFFQTIRSGADFYLGHAGQIKFTPPKIKPNPW